MPIFRVKSAQLEARKLTPDLVEDIAHWCNGYVVQEIDPMDPSKKYAAINLMISTGEISRASEGDYIVKYTNGRFGVLGEKHFFDTYEPIE